MNTKPLFIASSLVAFLIASALEGEGLSVGQAVLVLIPVCALQIWSFCQTDWYEPTERSRYYESAEVPQVSSGAERPGKYQHWLR